MRNIQVYIAADHAGYELKQHLLQSRLPVKWSDLGTNDTNSVNYPEFADLLAKKVRVDETAQGVLICGSGIGMSIRANRYSGVRAALCMTPEMSKLAREHNNANVLCLGARLISPSLAEEILEAFLLTIFAGGRHQLRVNQLDFPVKIE